MYFSNKHVISSHKRRTKGKTVMWFLLRPFEFISLIKEADKANNFALLLYEKIILIET